MSLNGLETRTLWLTVWHSDMFGRNDFLGEVRMPLENKIFDDPTPHWYPLQERVSFLAIIRKAAIIARRGSEFYYRWYVQTEFLSQNHRLSPSEVSLLSIVVHLGGCIIVHLAGCVIVQFSGKQLLFDFLPSIQMRTVISVLLLYAFDVLSYKRMRMQECSYVNRSFLHK